LNTLAHAGGPAEDALVSTCSVQSFWAEVRPPIPADRITWQAELAGGSGSALLTPTGVQEGGHRRFDVLVGGSLWRRG
jgi:hypothetical protein